MNPITIAIHNTFLDELIAPLHSLVPILNENSKTKKKFNLLLDCKHWYYNIPKDPRAL